MEGGLFVVCLTLFLDIGVLSVEGESMVSCRFREAFRDGDVLGVLDMVGVKNADPVQIAESIEARRGASFASLVI